MSGGSGRWRRWLAVLAAGVALVCAGQDRGITVRFAEQGQDHEVRLYDRSYALIIGVSKYTAGWPELPGVRDDVAAVEAAFREQGFITTTHLDLTAEALDKVLRSFVANEGQGANHRIVIYFAGHGHTLTPKWGGDPMGYLVPADAPLPSADLGGFLMKAVSLKRIEELALNLQCRHALFVFDSCFSGSVFAMSRAIPAHITYKTTRPVRQIITSGQADEEVPDKSLFRRQLVAALHGEGDINRDGYITGAELGQFLQESVIKYSNDSQHPQYGTIRHPRLDKGDLVIAAVAKPEASQPATGTVELRSEFPAEVYLDGNLLGKIDSGRTYRFPQIPGGKHRLRLANDAGAWEDDVQVVPDSVVQVAGGTTRAAPVPPRAVTETAPPTVPRVDPEATPPPVVHRLRKGETLWFVAHMYGLPVDQVAAYNDLSESQIKRLAPGIDIRLPPGSKLVPEEQRLKVYEAQVAGMLKYLHFVKPGDTLASIAAEYNSKVEWIYVANPGVRSDADLRKGMMLDVPVNEE